MALSKVGIPLDKYMHQLEGSVKSKNNDLFVNTGKQWTDLYINK